MQKGWGLPGFPTAFPVCPKSIPNLPASLLGNEKKNAYLPEPSVSLKEPVAFLVPFFFHSRKSSARSSVSVI